MENSNPRALAAVTDNDRERAISLRSGMGGGGEPVAIVPKTFLEVQSFAAAIASSALVPDKLRERAPDVCVMILAGLELGVAPMAALRLFHVIEGVPKLSADGIAAVVLASPLCEYLRRTEYSDERVTWVTRRRGGVEQSSTWTIGDAQKAGLAGRGNWTKYQRRMLSARAKSEVCRDTYPELVAGMLSAEEAYDERDATPVGGIAPTFTAPVSSSAPIVGTVVAGPPAASKRARAPKDANPPSAAPASSSPTIVDAPPAAAVNATPGTVELIEDLQTALVDELERPRDEPITDEEFDRLGAVVVRSLDMFGAELAAAKNQAGLDETKAQWLEWSKGDGKSVVVEMRAAYAARKAELAKELAK